MKYYIDLGGHFGEGLRSFIDMYNIDETWKIISFEPNIESFNILKVFNYKNCNIEFINKGVWVENKTLKFRPEKTSISYGSRNDGAGSTFIDGDDWNIKNNNNIGGGDFLDEYNIEVIDFNEFLLNLKEVDFLLVKMDIEGSEYEILRRIIKTNSISIINDIYVEFHDWAMKSENVYTTNELINTIENKGVNIKKWI